MSEIKELLLGHRASKGLQTSTAYEYSFSSIKDGSELPLSRYAGKVVVVVNTASLCMFTKQYASLQRVYERYEKLGLVIVGVPSNNFGKQEPGGSKEIKQLCRKTFDVTFPMTEKTSVRGKYRHEFYDWAEQILGKLATPKWNFHKYVIDREGHLVDFFVPSTSLESTRALKKIEQLLDAPYDDTDA